MCAVDEAEPWDVVWHERPRARKAWRCTECNRKIKPGEFYHSVRGHTYGGWSQYRTCLHCEAAGEWLQTVCGGWLYGGLYEEMVEHWRDGYTSVAFGRLIAGLRFGWHGGSDPVPDREKIRELAREMMRRQVYPVRMAG